jgi:hypothetical protein
MGEMHPLAGPLLAANHQRARERARGHCEACGTPVGPDVIPASPIDGLPTVEQMLVLCEPCAAVIMPELCSPSIPALDARMAQIRSARRR